MNLTDESKKRIIENIELSEPWERIKTNIDNVYITKAPEYNNKQPVFIEIKVGKNGTILTSLNHFMELKQTLENEGLEVLVEFIYQFYPTSSSKEIELEFTDNN